MVYHKLVDLLENKFSLDQDKINLSLNIQNDLGLDSLDIAQLLMEIEETFDIIIENDNIFSLVTLEDIVKYIEDKIKIDK